MTPIVQIIGPGRAGRSFFNALGSKGWQMKVPLEKGNDLRNATDGVDLVLITTPDNEIINVVNQLPRTETVIAHVAGSMRLDVLKPHVNVGSIHPLVSLPNAILGKERLLNNAWFAINGDPLMKKIVEALDGSEFILPDEYRALYHATACIASNHLVVLLEQVRRLADQVNVPFEAFLNLAQGSFESLIELGPGDALTGPAARKDEETLQAHLESLPEIEIPLYESMVLEAKRLATNTNDLEE